MLCDILDIFVDFSPKNIQSDHLEQGDVRVAVSFCLLSAKSFRGFCLDLVYVHTTQLLAKH